MSCRATVALGALSKGVRTPWIATRLGSDDARRSRPHPHRTSQLLHRKRAGRRGHVRSRHALRRGEPPLAAGLQDRWVCRRAQPLRGLSRNSGAMADDPSESARRRDALRRVRGVRARRRRDPVAEMGGETVALARRRYRRHRHLHPRRHRNQDRGAGGRQTRGASALDPRHGSRRDDRHRREGRDCLVQRRRLGHARLSARGGRRTQRQHADARAVPLRA